MLLVAVWCFALGVNLSVGWGDRLGDIDECLDCKLAQLSQEEFILLAEANVATVTGDAFGSPNCLRLSYATSEELLIEALKRIKEALI